VFLILPDNIQKNFEFLYFFFIKRCRLKCWWKRYCTLSAVSWKWL